MFKLKAKNGRNNICGQNLTKLRLEKGWSQRRLARELQLAGYDVDHHFVRRIENGQRFVTDLELVILSEVLQEDITNLLDFSIPIVCPDSD